ncbi:acetoin utilization protein AcuC [Inmirania thermothiophila]|uniref:Acetoin utilization protein AcuC n=1 Tax=Inmirania thermothiophila TaxID=1750597 RepID=A0A3N1Y880_9GAMM|nr:acetoin utilization protein AcuC [Inmirania thermothiophila]ROR34960.1 acetoin utilization protein AcuC [Inmirania thermothiophila]
MSGVCVYYGEALGRYGFGEGHPFDPRRLADFWAHFTAEGLDREVTVCEPATAPREAIERFHTPAYVARVMEQSRTGQGYLDYGDTPAYRGVYEAAATVVGTVLDAVERLMAGRCRRAFVPIAGLHHARRATAGGFCVFNDIGVAIETLRAQHGLRRIAYVDIDAHHGDGVFYSYDDDPDLLFADFHEDGRYLYPGTGAASEDGRGPARGTKINVPLPPGADDEAFLAAWPRVEAYLDAGRPEFVILQCGADSIAGDPLTHLAYSPAVHRHVAARLARLADRHCQGRLLALGGGGYDHRNLARAWTEVVRGLLEPG